MADQFELNAELRSDKGKGASRRLRRNADMIPAILYGAGKDPQPLSIAHKDIHKACENEAFFSHIITIKAEGKQQKFRLPFASKDGKTRVVALFAKRARGMMADYIIRNRIEKPADLKKFKEGGYKFSRALSDDTQWTFERPQPPSP